MTTMTDPRVDAYIAKAAPFARPILEKLRKAFHKGCPAAAETMKWSTPYFEKDGLVGGMAAFKAHVSFTLWKGHDLEDPQGLFAQVGKTNMAAVKVASVNDLPTQAVLCDYIKRAAALNVVGAECKPAAKRKPAPKTPADLAAALKQNAKARKTFEALPPSGKREYVDWITEAKRDATRTKRLETSVLWLSEGKRRNWKYENC